MRIRWNLDARSPESAGNERGGFFRRAGKVIVPLTVREILDERIAMKLA